MDTTLRTSIWRQFGASIDYLGETIGICPDQLWHSPLWSHRDEHTEFSQFWYRAYHTLFWLDLYLFGSEEGFAPPPPFTLIEQTDDGPIPERPYTKAELLLYLKECRKKCKTILDTLTDERAKRQCQFPWGEVSYLELLLYNMRHVQEHAAQLNLILGQEVGSTPDYLIKVQDEVVE